MRTFLKGVLKQSVALLLWPKHAIERRHGSRLNGWTIPLLLLWWLLLLHVLVWSAFGLVCSSMLALSAFDR